MLRALLLISGVLAISLAEYVWYPGHTYLQADSQSGVAMLERLDSPGFLSRDLVATNPNLTYTIYDEVTLFLHRIFKFSLRAALEGQQVVGRIASVLAIVLFGLWAKLRPIPALAVAGLINLGMWVPGIHIATVDPEPTGFAFALSFTVLALGLILSGRPFLAGLSGGLALCYQPSIAALFWLTALLTFFMQPSLRPLLRPTLPAFLVSVLLLANASQLQPGLGESQAFFTRMSPAWVELQRRWLPELWLSKWLTSEIISCFAILFAGWGTALVLRKQIPSATSSVLLIAIGICTLSLPVALLTTEALHWPLGGEIQPARSVVLGCFLSLTACAIAGVKLWRKQRIVGVTLILIPVAVTSCLRVPRTNEFDNRSVAAVAKWAENNTWGGSMFLFADPGISNSPGVFRGSAVRAVYIDWNSRSLIAFFPQYAAEWDRRWRQQTQDPARLPALPIEYLVVRTGNVIAGAQPELTTSRFVVYDAAKLRAKRLN